MTKEAEAYLAKHTLDAYRAAHFGIKQPRSWSDAVVRYLTIKQHLRSFKDAHRISRSLDRYLSHLTLQQIDGDVVWTVIQGESKKGNKACHHQSLFGAPAQFVTNGTR